MTDAPERNAPENESWFVVIRRGALCLPTGNYPKSELTEVVRADIAAARIAALEADLARARERVEALERAALKPAP